jgi:ZIP family zinc transporter
MLSVLAISLLPIAGVFAGCLLAETVKTPKWLIGASLHATAGIAIALVSIDLMPRILIVTPVWFAVIAFLAGAAGSFGLTRIWLHVSSTPGHNSLSAWMVYMAVVVDLISDGLMVGTGAAVQTGFGVLIAATQSIANIPGGFAATSNFRDDGMPRARRLLLAVLAAAPAVLATLAGFVMLKGAEADVQSTVLAFFVGVLLLTTVEDVIPEADAPRPPRWISTLAFAIGFSGLALMSEVFR